MACACAASTDAARLRRVDEMLGMMHQALADRRVDQLSGGQRQRVRWRAPSPCSRACCCWTNP